MIEDRMYHFKALAIPKSSEAHVVFEKVSLYITGKYRLNSWKRIKTHPNKKIKALYYGLLIDCLFQYANKSVYEIESLTGTINQKMYATYLQQLKSQV